MNRRWWSTLIVGLLALGSLAWVKHQYGDHGFPHARHAKLFPTCSGCHAGILTGDSTTTYPAPALCVQCHNGHDAKEVHWDGPTRVATNLRFVHREHAQHTANANDTAHCETCHAPQASSPTSVPAKSSAISPTVLPDTTRIWMAVSDAQPTGCLACHAHRATSHFAIDDKCATCHVPLTDATTLPESTIATFPQPPSHAQSDFVLHHAPTTPLMQAQCAVCHARESCERCHVNGATMPAVMALASDPRVARLVASLPASQYPVPVSHHATSWSYAHGAEARRDIASCANCHTQPSCRSCHIGGSGATEIAKLPVPVPGAVSGVVLRAASSPLRPVSQSDSGPRSLMMRVHPATFVTAHGSAAATQQTSCLGCHKPQFCEGCHGGRVTRSFHPTNFVARHAADAYARVINCAQCHTTESFCRNCHMNVGVAERGQHHAAFHTGQPLWLLQHGQAARQDLPTCTSCHQERDCLQCHSTVGWGVNPHGPNFDARRMAARNPAVCLVCHLSNPLAGGGPR